MDILMKAFGALWQVVAVGLLLGAGLPTLFALGIRALDSDPRVVAVGPDGVLTRPSGRARAVAAACFGVCLLAVAFGIVVIIFGKQMFG